jgi:hypothetical protein
VNDLSSLIGSPLLRSGTHLGSNVLERKRFYPRRLDSSQYNPQKREREGKLTRRIRD